MCASICGKGKLKCFSFYTINLFSKWFVNDNFQLIHLTLSILFEIKSTNMSCLVSFCHKIGYFFFSFIEWKQDFFLFLFFPFDMRIELNCCFHFNWMSLTRFICFFLYVVMFIFTFSKSNLLLVLLLGEKKKKSRKIEWSSAVMAID